MNLPATIRREIDLGNTTRAKKINRMLHGAVAEAEIIREVHRLWPGVLTVEVQPPVPSLAPVVPIKPQIVVDFPPETDPLVIANTPPEPVQAAPPIGQHGAVGADVLVDRILAIHGPYQLTPVEFEETLSQAAADLHRNGNFVRGHRTPLEITVLRQLSEAGRISDAKLDYLKALAWIDSENLKTARACAEMSQSQLAKALATKHGDYLPWPSTQPKISNMELAGPIWVPRSCLKALAAILECEPSDLEDTTVAPRYAEQFFGIKREVEEVTETEVATPDATQERKFDDGDREYEAVSDETWEAMAAAKEAEEAAEITERAKSSLDVPGSMAPFLRQAIASLTTMVDPLAKLEAEKDAQVANLKRQIERQEIVIDEQRRTIRRLEEALLK